VSAAGRALSNELARALGERLLDLARQIEFLVGSVGPTASRLRRALEVVQPYPAAAMAALNEELERAPDEVTRIEHARNFLLHATSIAGLVEDWLTRSLDSPAPLSLVRAMERECELLGEPRSALLSVGSADNYVTYIGELSTTLYNWSPRMPTQDPELAGRKFALMRLPRAQASRAAYWPVILGHELAHLALLDRGTVQSLNLGQLVRALLPESVADFPARTPDARLVDLQEIAELWVEEVICDCYAVRRFGPASLASLSSVLDSVGATFSVSRSHPPGQVRIRLMLSWLRDGWTWSQSLTSPWRMSDWEDMSWAPLWAQTLSSLLMSVGARLPEHLEQQGWPDAIPDSSLVAERVVLFRDDLAAGRLALPSSANEALAEHAEAHVVNALWLASTTEDEMVAPVDRLAVKSLDSLNFLRLWNSAGGDLVADPLPDPPGAERGALSGPAISHRLHAEAADDAKVWFTPLLPRAVSGAALDLRLGSSFIVFRRMDTTAIDPIDPAADPRVMQTRVEKDWGQPFVLHPGELVLAATLEYLVMPSDLTAQVVTRSSYGRLGLITATAVLVHPHYRGSLTLELVNLGVLPITLTPGQRIAQLMFMPCAPIARPPAKYDCPTVPEFSKVSRDPDSDVLSRLRRLNETPPSTSAT
jgi:deoxycytidine triphosphate deaminase